MKRCKDYSRHQQLLLPPDLNDWLEEGHLAYFIRDVVGELDLYQIYDDYHSQRGGQPAYQPGARWAGENLEVKVVTLLDFALRGGDEFYKALGPAHYLRRLHTYRLEHDLSRLQRELLLAGLERLS